MPQMHPSSPVACICGECFNPSLEDYPRTYTCATCDREVPWCFGAGDDYEDCCDDCWAVADKMHAAVGIDLSDKP